MAGLPWSRADTGHFSTRYVMAEMVKDRLKSALVAEVNLSKMTKQANLASLPFTSFQSVFPFCHSGRVPREIPVGR